MEEEYNISQIAGSLKSGEYIGKKRAGFFLFGLCLAVVLFAAAAVGLILGFSSVIVIEPFLAFILLADGGAALALGIACFRYLIRRKAIRRDFGRCAGTFRKTSAQAAATGVQISRVKKFQTLRLRFKIDGKKYNKSGTTECKLFAECVRRQKVNILFSDEFGEVFILKEGLTELTNKNEENG